MTTVTGYTSARIQLIEDTTVVDGEVGDDGYLRLYTREGAVLQTKNPVTGDKGDKGDPGGAIISEDSIFTNAIQDYAVTSDKLEPSAVTSSKIAPSAVLAEHIQDSAVQSNHINDEDVLTRHIQDKAVTGSKLNDNAVSSTKLSPNSVGSEHMQTDSVLSEALNDSAVTTPKIADAAVTGVKINTNAVTESKIKPGSVTSEKIPDQTIYATQCVSSEWNDIALEAGWENYEGRQTAQYRKFLDGIQFRGTIRHPETVSDFNIKVFSINSEDFRPDLEDNYPATGTASSPGMYWNVQPGGDAYIYNLAYGGPDGDELAPVGAVSLTGIFYTKA